ERGRRDRVRREDAQREPLRQALVLELPGRQRASDQQALERAVSHDVLLARGGAVSSPLRPTAPGGRSGAGRTTARERAFCRTCALWSRTADIGHNGRPQGGHCMRFPARTFAAVVTVATAAVPLIAAEAPSAGAAPTWAPAATAAIHPGVQTFTNGAQCTANLVLYDA